MLNLNLKIVFRLSRDRQLIAVNCVTKKINRIYKLTSIGEFTLITKGKNKARLLSYNRGEADIHRTPIFPRSLRWS